MVRAGSLYLYELCSSEIQFSENSVAESVGTFTVEHYNIFTE